MSSQQSAISSQQSTVARRSSAIGKFFGNVWLDAVTLVVVFIIFVVPFVFIFLTAAKTSPEAGLFQFSWPSQFQLLDNIRDVLTYGDGRMFVALLNSTILTAGSLTIIVMLAALVAYIMQRRRDRVAALANSVI